MEEAEKIKERKEVERKLYESRHQLIMRTYSLLTKVTTRTK